MKQAQVSAAYQTLIKLKDSELPISAAYRLSLLIKKLEPLINSEIDLERRLLQKYEGVVTEDGRIDFSGKNSVNLIQTETDKHDDMQDRMNGFVREMNELQNQEIDVEFTPVELRLSTLDEVKMSLADVAKLDGFVNFIE